MPFATKFIEDGRGIVFQGSGIVTEDELAAARMALLSDPVAMLRVTFALIDLENVVEMRVDYDGIRRLVGMDERIAKVAAGMAVAIVAASDHTFGIARMWKTMAERTGWSIVVVRSLSEAHAWLAQTLAPRAQPSATPTDV